MRYIEDAARAGVQKRPRNGRDPAGAWEYCMRIPGEYGHSNNKPWSPIAVFAIYVIVAGIYIVASDFLVYILLRDVTNNVYVNTTKGLAFIVVSGGLIFWLMQRSQGRVAIRDRFLNDLVSALNEAVVVVALPSRTIVSANPLAGQMFGYDEADMVGRSTDPLHESEDSCQRLHGMSIGTLEAGHPFRTECPMRRADGSVFRARISVSIFDRATGERFAVSVINDITEEHEREQRLRRREALLRQIMDNIRHVFWLSAPDTSEILYLSPAYEAIWGRPRAELERNAAALLETVHPDDRERFSRFVERKPREDQAVEYRIVRSDGTTRWIRDQSFRIRDEQGQVYRCAGLAEDITEAKEQERAVRSAEKMELLGQLAAGVAHDFNNMLMVISLNLELALENELTSAERESLEMALRAAERSADLTKRLLSFSGRQVLTPELVDLNQEIGETAKLLERTLGEAIRVELRRSDGPAMVNLDRNELEHAILNLALNARDAMPRGGRLAIAVGLERGEGTADEIRAAGAIPPPRVRVSVSDSGEGMDVEVLERVLEPFFTTKKGAHATGLGLSSAYGFVQQSGGDMRIESTPGEGTTVTMFFPAAGADDVEPPGEPATPRGSAASRAYTVLVVEDQDAVRETVQRLLERLGHRPLVASDAGEGLAALEAHPEIDILLSDVLLPGEMDGVGLALEAQARRPGLPILLMSGYFEDAVKRREAADADFEILGKPIAAERLDEKLAAAFDRGAERDDTDD